MSRRVVLVAFVVVVVAVALIAASVVSSDSQRIEARVDQLLMAVRVDDPGQADARRARIERAVSEVAAPDVVVHVPDFEPPRRGRAELVRLLVGAGQGYDSAMLSTEELAVRVAESGGATVQVVVHARAERGEQLLTDTRNVRLAFVRVEERWRLSGVEVAAKTHEAPEARP